MHKKNPILSAKEKKAAFTSKPVADLLGQRKKKEGAEKGKQPGQGREALFEKQKEKKIFLLMNLKGDYEIVSLTGTINTMNDEYYSHMHLSAGNDQGEVFGGHLNKAIVSATCEMVIQVINGQVDRYFDEEIGLNLLKL